ncbi:uncharacterized protein LOC127566222 [Drosophila albomicans]|uniref:Uncharacterized protein LOC127566222 n=1 Tax=Drosophila albomicans TaxID=7291 RepID=A0A9C6WLW1_DROAB|nr:uncharacterized protein LOC127566222 [Drosophila albomicans]
MSKSQKSEKDSKHSLKLPTTARRLSSASPAPSGSKSATPAAQHRVKVDRPSPSASAKTPPLRTSSTAPRSQATTRSVQAKLSETRAMALSNFVSVSDRLVHFESRVRGPVAEDDNVHTYEIRRDRLQALWDNVEAAYSTCADALHRDGDSEGTQAMEAKYDHCYAVYERCLARVKGQITQVYGSSRSKASVPPVYSSGCRLPPVDTEVFRGDYLRWPTFRDLFTAIYVNNPRLTPVEKLFHLNSKIADEANEIVAKFPLTNDGFASAWGALCERFENKRFLITSQLKILFNLSTVTQESGAAIKELQSTIQRCLTALEHSDISVCSPVANCILVFLCSSKLPKLTLSLWEQSLVDKAKIPAWQDMSTFLNERCRTLEAIEDVKQNANPQNATAVPSRPQNSKRVNSFEARVTPKGKSCDLCSKENHPVRNVLLGTAVINVCHLGTTYTARALIDSGSEAIFISERLFQRIKLPFQSVRAQVSGLNHAVAAQSQKLCHFSIGSPMKPRLHIETSAFVIPQLAGKLPSFDTPRTFLRNLPAIELADPHFYKSAQIDILIGADILPSFILSGSRPNICGSLLGQETVFGWILTDPVSQNVSTTFSAFSTRVALQVDEQLDSLLSKFWEVEDIPAKLIKESDFVCEENFVKTTSRSKCGRYRVTLPFRKPDGIELGHSRSIALAQFLKNENRLTRDDSLKEQYNAVLQEYVDLGHMTPISPQAIVTTPNLYLPHHAVFKPDSTTTKVRILRWRYYRYVFNMDITKMYRQILMDSKLTPFQRILFRTSDGEIRDFELSTVTFGVNCAPFLALRVLQQLADDTRLEYPLASRVISNNMYVDDVLAGTHTKEEAIRTIAEVCAALDSAGFPLRNTAKTLGIRWQAHDDEFFFMPPEVAHQDCYTKREVLSQIAKLFDPAGWLAPFVIRPKIFMQEIWLRTLEWDEHLPTDLLLQWKEYLQSYPALGKIRIPRWVQFQTRVKLQYHGFCDASERAYRAAIHVRVEMASKVSTHLLTAKTKVAPVKSLSVPRLELCGADLLAELSAALLLNLPAESFQTFFWTDSTIVLAWLNKPPCRWTTFVANRVAKIVQASDAKNWSHVRSEHNPADLASRGVLPQELMRNPLWWHGPEWLHLPSDQWPTSPSPIPETLLEQRIKCNVAKLPPTPDFLNKFSEFGNALRTSAYVLRFSDRSRKLAVPSSTVVQADELSRIQERLIVMAQRQTFQQEYHCLQSKQQVPSSSSVRNLNSFLDGKGILRACGRLRASHSLRYDESHPIILSYSSSFARLLVRFTHRISLHGGNQVVMRLIRSRFWIPKLKVLVKSTINSCKVCVIYKKRLQTQMMGDLPKERASYSRPFTHTGVDFAGPFEIKNYTGRACLITKGYICVFVCFSAKAIHLEATSDLTTEKFLAAFSRFIARRGCPYQMYSDNGKTFVGADKVISNDFLEATRECVIAQHAHKSLSWHFNPPGAPHMGGLWEAVKSFKALFYKATSTGKYTFEKLSTLLAKIEACLNSRPITPLYEDPSDLLALTPGHFLVGGPLISVLGPPINQPATSILNRWQRLKALHQQFCFRWKDEYLKELHKKTKWQSPTWNLRIGDMVVIKEDNLPSNEWRLGRVLTTCPGTDAKVRVLDVLTARGTIRRPVAKLILLPMDSKTDPSTSEGLKDG